VDVCDDAGCATDHVTAIFTLSQVQFVIDAVNGGRPVLVSVFVGPVIADTGTAAMPLMDQAVRCPGAAPNTKLIWASPRELLNIFQADAIGCHVITVTIAIFQKLPLAGKSLGDYSLETVGCSIIVGKLWSSCFDDNPIHNRQADVG
jgi:transaldolase